MDFEKSVPEMCKIVLTWSLKKIFYVVASHAEYFKKPFKMFHLHPSNGF